MKFHHIGIATDNYSNSEKFIRSTHRVTNRKGPIYDENLNATLSIFDLEEGPSIELVEGIAVEGILKKRINIYHFCYEVEDINLKLKSFNKFGGKTILEPTPAKLFDNRLVAFVFTPIGIIELLNTK